LVRFVLEFGSIFAGDQVVDREFAGPAANLQVEGADDGRTALERLFLLEFDLILRPS
jgi:hypothetical protein